MNKNYRGLMNPDITGVGIIGVETITFNRSRQNRSRPGELKI